MPGPPADSVSPDERQLVERAREDPDAFADLYRRYVDRIHAYALRRTGSRELAEDITAATFERALAGMHRFRWGSGGFAPWIFRIAANELTDHYRREGRRRGERAARAVDRTQDRVAVGELDHVDARADAEALRTALDEINPRYQRALTLRYLSGLDHEDAASAMGLTKPVFAVLLHRATAALRKAMPPGADIEGPDEEEVRP